MKKIVLITLSLLSLSACSFVQVHKMDVEQGNIMPESAVNQLHPGMSEAEVRAQLGTPILINTFSDNRLNYVYTFKSGYGEFTEKCITLTFKNGALSQIQNKQ